MKKSVFYQERKECICHFALCIRKYHQVEGYPFYRQDQKFSCWDQRRRLTGSKKENDIVVEMPALYMDDMPCDYAWTLKLKNVADAMNLAGIPFIYPGSGSKSNVRRAGCKERLYFSIFAKYPPPGKSSCNVLPDLDFSKLLMTIFL